MEGMEHLRRAAGPGRQSAPARLLGLLALLAAIVGGCGGDTRGGGGGGGGETKSKGESAEETANVARAWEEDAKKIGLEPLTPPSDKVSVTDTAQLKKDGPYRIAFASQGPTNSWAVTYDETLKTAAKEKYGDQIDKILYADANGDADKQVADIEDLVAQQPDALVVTPLGAAVKAPIERAASAGVPVVLCSGKVDTTSYVTRVDRDNTLNGTLMAEWVAKQIDNKGEIIMLSGIPGVPTAEDRLAAARKVFKKYPDIKVLAHEYTNWSPTESKGIVEGLLVKHKQIDAIWSDSGINNVGGIEAFREAKRSIPPMTGEPLNGFLRLASENDVSFAAVGYPPSHSGRCLQAAVETLQGKPQPTFINVDAPMFTDKEIGRYYRKECSDDLWVPTEFPPAKLKQLKLC